LHAGDLTDCDWPFVRGPRFNGHSTETHLAGSWPKKGPPILWTRELGQGYSAFVAWDDRIATQYQTSSGQYVICLDADTGRTVWQHRYDWPYEAAGVYPGPRATPTYWQGRLYFAGPRGTIGCLDAGRGRPLWQVNIHERFGSSGTEFGYSCSPTVVGGLVFLPVGGVGASLVALSASDGAVVWQAGEDVASYTPAYPITFRGQHLVLGYLQNALVCHDQRTGKLIWRHPLSAGYDEHAAWPIYREPHLWISSAFQGGSELLELTGEADHPLRAVWTSRLMSNDIFSSVLVDDALYGFDLKEAQAKTHRPSRGQFRCIDFLSGREYWSDGNATQRREPASVAEGGAGRIGHATVLVADGKLILLNDTGELILARATKEHYEELARVTVLGGEICWTQPALNHGRLFVRNQSRAACVYIGDPGLLARETLAAATTAADVPQSQYIDVAGFLLGVEPEYAFDLPSASWLRRWFLVSLVGILGLSLLATLAAKVILGRRLSVEALPWLFSILAFALGTLGTTVVSKWTGDFVFTWPVSLFIAFQVAVSELRWGHRDTERHWRPWRARLAGLAFVLCCAAYFLLCRRLSLVFEWAFLCGFVPALPFTLAATHAFVSSRYRFAWTMIMTATGFCSFYWSAAALLWFKG
jgi:outer membrane protein assembly factor BamB